MYSRVRLIDIESGECVGFRDSLGNSVINRLSDALRTEQVPIHQISENVKVFDLPDGEIGYLPAGKTYRNITSNGQVVTTPDGSRGYVGPCKFIFKGVDLILEGKPTDPVCNSTISHPKPSNLMPVKPAVNDKYRDDQHPVNTMDWTVPDQTSTYNIRGPHNGPIPALEGLCNHFVLAADSSIAIEHQTGRKTFTVQKYNNNT